MNLDSAARTGTVPRADEPSPDTERVTVLAELVDLLDLTAGPGSPDTFTGRSLVSPMTRIFGGQLLAQSIMAASRTVADDRPVHSLHAYFLRPGDPHLPLTFSVQRLRDGKSFSARQVIVLQDDRPILSMISSFQRPGPGPDHQVPMPQVPAPEELPSLAQRYPDVDHPLVHHWTHRHPVQLHHLDRPVLLEPSPGSEPHQAVWMRTPAAVPDVPSLHAALLAYFSDFTVLEPAVRHHGLTWADPELNVASLDHSMWWHRQVRVDEWILNVQESPSSGGARALGTGRFYSHDGTLVCTVAQEGMFRH
ncbi:MAG: acyl-CoA thioesterase [Actinomycetota bacterium]|nr:acyl-CoA thioesterase [Actinomycetota bacterium]